MFKRIDVTMKEAVAIGTALEVTINNAPDCFAFPKMTHEQSLSYLIGLRDKYLEIAEGLGLFVDKELDPRYVNFKEKEHEQC